MIKSLFRQPTMSKPSKAFSLIELSIVVLIIGILIAGVTQGSRLVRQSRISTAQNQTLTSPVNSITNLVGWWETTSSNSFRDSETDDGSQPTIWYDISSQSVNKNNATPGATVAGSATYRPNAMNGLPALVFAGTSLNQSFALSDNTVINSSDYTIFAVESHSAAPAKNFFLCGSATVTSAPYNNLVLGYSTVASNTVAWSHLTAIATATNYASGIVAPAVNVETIHSFVNKISNGVSAKRYFMNGAQQTLTTNDANSLASWAGASIGCSLAVSPGGAFTGAIGEVIIYNRALSNEERKSVESYLGKKWAINVV